jgi:formylglycine-generating enzyme
VVLRASSSWAIGIALLGASCSSLLGLDGLVADRTPDSGPGPDGAEADAPRVDGGGEGGCSAACGSPGCGACPAARVTLGTFAIDRYEVTVGDYRAFLDTRPMLDGQSAECAWNDTFVPGILSESVRALFADAGITPDPGCAATFAGQIERGELDRPVACIDWCDAAAFCRWAKGRLCGGADGESLVYLTDKMPTRGEWWSACSQEGASAYPYGNDYVAGTCNDSNTRLFDVGSYPGCQARGVFDLSGNVAEWEDACDGYSSPPEMTNCLRRGGAFWNDATNLTCETWREGSRGGLDPTTGFRCCGPP